MFKEITLGGVTIDGETTSVDVSGRKLIVVMEVLKEEGTLIHLFRSEMGTETLLFSPRELVSLSTKLFEIKKELLGLHSEISGGTLISGGRDAMIDTIFDKTDVLHHLGLYLGWKPEVIQFLVFGRDTRMPLAVLWHDMNPMSKEDFKRFYAAETGSYLWDLAAFNTNPYYWEVKAAPALELKGKVVDFGGGLGSLSIALALAGRSVIYVDLESPQRRFAEWRFQAKHLNQTIKVVSSLSDVSKADNIVAIDVIEHIHPEELPHVCQEFARILPQGGVAYTANEFGQAREWPMHQDTRQIFEDEMRKADFHPSSTESRRGREGGPAIWVKS